MKKEITLIIPDVHLKHERMEEIIKHVDPDKIIFLGDYFDDFGDSPETIGDTCDWFSWSVKQPNRIHLYGNHDMHYSFAANDFKCSGYAQWKSFLINDRIDRKSWNQLRYYHILDDTWLLSHGGLHKQYLPTTIGGLHENRKQFLSELSKYLDNSVVDGHRGHGWIFNAGFGRGGLQTYGGLTWCDYKIEFQPSIGLNQIFGHTPQRLDEAYYTVLANNTIEKHVMDSNITGITDPFKSINIDLDSIGNPQWAIWDGKKIVIQNYKKHI